MTKAFFDAFPTVMPEDEELSSLLEHTTVTKVAVSEKRAQLRIYLDADRLIGKKDLEKVEKTFDEEFASGQGLKTKIIEHFHLSGQYTPKNLMRAYRSSILYELQGYQKCIYTMFRGADLHFHRSCPGGQVPLHFLPQSLELQRFPAIFILQIQKLSL